MRMLRTRAPRRSALTEGQMRHEDMNDMNTPWLSKMHLNLYEESKICHTQSADSVLCVHGPSMRNKTGAAFAKTKA